MQTACCFVMEQAAVQTAWCYVVEQSSDQPSCQLVQELQAQAGALHSA